MLAVIECMSTGCRICRFSSQNNSSVHPYASQKSTSLWKQGPQATVDTHYAQPLQMPRKFSWTRPRPTSHVPHGTQQDSSSYTDRSTVARSTFPPMLPGEVIRLSRAGKQLAANGLCSATAARLALSEHSMLIVCLQDVCRSCCSCSVIIQFSTESTFSAMP